MSTTRQGSSLVKAAIALLATTVLGNVTTSAIAVPIGPAIPSGVTATVTQALSANVSWSTSDLNNTDTSFTVTSYPGLKSCTVKNVMTCVVTGLTAKTSYRFKVVASNDIDSSAASAFSAPVSAADKPSLVSNVAVARGDGRLLVTWDVGDIANGSPLTGFTATTSPSGSCTSDAATNFCVITGLTNGMSYSVRVAAINSIGAGSGTTGIIGVPAGLPIGPSSFAAIATSDTTLRFTWAAASANGAAPMTYAFVIKDESKSIAFTSAPTGTTQDVTGLSPDHQYTASLTATNGVGAGTTATTTASTLRMAPFAPGSVTALATDGAATVSWSAPSIRGSAITGYTATVTPSAKSCTVDSATTMCSFIGLANGTAYTFTVVAQSLAGTSDAASTNATPSGKPFAPTGVTATDIGKGTRIRISWTLPDSNGSALTGYRVTSTPSGADCGSESGAVGFCEVGGLTDGMSYVFKVMTKNKNGDGPTSSSAAFVAHAAAPGQLTGVMMQRAMGAVKISVGGIEFDGGAATTYTATLTPGNRTCAITPNQDGAGECSVTGLDNSVLYDASVVAKNSKGTGPRYDLDGSLDVWTNATTLPKGETFSAYFVGALARAKVVVTYGKTSITVKASATGAGSATFTATSSGSTAVKASYGIYHASTAPLWVPLVSLTKRIKQGGSANLVVMSAGKGVPVDVSRVGGLSLGTVTSSSDTALATFVIDTATRGTFTYDVKVNGVTLPRVSIQVY